MPTYAVDQVQSAPPWLQGKYGAAWNAALGAQKDVIALLAKEAVKSRMPGYGSNLSGVVTDHGFGVGNGVSTTFQLQRTMGGGYSDALGTYASSSKPRTNLLTWSQDFSNAAWTKTTGVTVAADATTAPDGTPTADRITYDGTGAAGGARISQNGATTPLAGVACSSGLWLRADAPLSLVLTNNLGQTSTLAITTAWQRLQLAGTGTGALALGLGLASPGGVNTAFTVYAWQGQAEQAAALSQGIVTTATAVTVTPSYWPAMGDGFEPVYETGWGNVVLTQEGDWQGKRTLYATTRTNLLHHSEPLLANLDTKSGTVTQGALTDNGLSNGVAFPAAAQLDYGYENVTFTAGLQYTLRVFVKMNDASAPVVTGLNNTGDFGLVVQGVLVASAATITALGGGLYKVQSTVTSASSGAAGAGVVRYAAQSGKAFTVTGFHLEQAPVAGSYIKTTGAAAVTVTDYTLGSNGAVTLAAAPPAGAVLAWTGSWVDPIPVCAPDALPVIGQELGIVRGLAELEAQYRSRLTAAFTAWQWAGTPYGLLSVLVAMGYPAPMIQIQGGATQYTLDAGGSLVTASLATPLHLGGAGREVWSDFAVFLMQPWASWWGGTAPVDGSADQQTVAAVVKAWKPAHTRCVQLGPVSGPAWGVSMAWNAFSYQGVTSYPMYGANVTWNKFTWGRLGRWTPPQG